MSSLKPHAAACSGRRVIPPQHGRWVPLYRHHGPCSPSSSTGAAKPSLDDLLRQDQLRVDHIHWRLSSESDEGAFAVSKASVKQRVGFEAAYFHDQPVIRVILGSESKSSEQQQQQGVPPGVFQTVVLDTAADLPWVQCAPCPVPPCHPQADDSYDPSRSPTYAPVKCGDDACDQLGIRYSGGCGVGGECQYRVPFPTKSNGSFSSGTYAVDLLAVGPNTSITFHFGCSHAAAAAAAGDFDDNTTAGVMALGGGPESLASQAEETYGRAFSYCIPAATERRLGFFYLGGGAPGANIGVDPTTMSYVATTPMIRYSQTPTFYIVRLVGINVNGQRLNVTPSVFAAGAVMDSRTAVTRLPKTAYAALREAFRGAMAMYAAAPPKGSLDTCYDFSGEFFVVPHRIELVFDGAGGGGGGVPVEVDRSGVLFNDCLAFVNNSDDRMLGILGNLQQQTMEVLFDVANKAVGFRRGAC
nr:unnamed protein product [Digitaria exilis]